jgi:hypothetical protein
MCVGASEKPYAILGLTAYIYKVGKLHRFLIKFSLEIQKKNHVFWRRQKRTPRFQSAKLDILSERLGNGQPKTNCQTHSFLPQQQTAPDNTHF